MEIARAAAGLFMSRGLRATRAEDIAQAAGIAPRTFYRYFATKEEAVAPLYAAGAQRWAEAVRYAPGDLSVPQALEHAVRHTLTPGLGVSASSWERLRTLIRLALTDPALRKVWAEVCRGSEETLGEILAGRVRSSRAGDGGDNVAGGSESLEFAPGSGDSESPELAPGTPRFTAAVASAAVRVAVEVWAEGDAPPAGPGGPAELALRHLAALRGFEWGSGG
ncbi:TetR family transcriptional regulator [Streptomyces sp. NPDC018693]|uniref:TetR family transcriptional regulator n=1 Tax=unclassified Streptomyces TaxID=2593676 RepID=UPI0037ADA34E